MISKVIHIDVEEVSPEEIVIPIVVDIRKIDAVGAVAQGVLGRRIAAGREKSRFNRLAQGGQGSNIGGAGGRRFKS